MKLSNLNSPNGNAVPNQFEIRDDNGFIFQLQMVKKFPDRCNQIVKNRSSFNYHPQQD